jgi:hypothetical protein
LVFVASETVVPRGHYITPLVRGSRYNVVKALARDHACTTREISVQTKARFALDLVGDGIQAATIAICGHQRPSLSRRVFREGADPERGRGLREADR